MQDAETMSIQCMPIRKAWDMEVPGTSVNTTLAATIPGAINTAIDYIIVFLPMPLVWGLHMQRRWRVQIVGIFVLSGL